MSTRCSINIIDSDNLVTIYHHYDGYPEGVGAELNEMFEEDLKLAQKKMKYLYLPDVVNKMIKYRKSNYEFTIGKHSDIEFLYEINLSELKMKCWSVKYNDKKKDYDKLKEIDLSKYYQKQI